MLAQQHDDLRAEVVAQRAQLLGLTDDEDVRRVVVRLRKLDLLVGLGRSLGRSGLGQGGSGTGH